MREGWAIVMGEISVNRVKHDVKREFKIRKKAGEETLKLSHVYEDVARRAGYRGWTTYHAFLRAIDEDGNGV